MLKLHFLVHLEDFHWTLFFFVVILIISFGDFSWRKGHFIKALYLYWSALKVSALDPFLLLGSRSLHLNWRPRWWIDDLILVSFALGHQLRLFDSFLGSLLEFVVQNLLRWMLRNELKRRLIWSERGMIFLPVIFVFPILFFRQTNGSNWWFELTFTFTLGIVAQKVVWPDLFETRLFRPVILQAFFGWGVTILADHVYSFTANVDASNILLLLWVA